MSCEGLAFVNSRNATRDSRDDELCEGIWNVVELPGDSSSDHQPCLWVWKVDRPGLEKLNRSRGDRVDSVTRHENRSMSLAVCENSAGFDACLLSSSSLLFTNLCMWGDMPIGNMSRHLCIRYRPITNRKGPKCSFQKNNQHQPLCSLSKVIGIGETMQQSTCRHQPEFR